MFIKFKTLNTTIEITKKNDKENKSKINVKFSLKFIRVSFITIIHWKFVDKIMFIKNIIKNIIKNNVVLNRLIKIIIEHFL